MRVKIVAAKETYLLAMRCFAVRDSKVSIVMILFRGIFIQFKQLVKSSLIDLLKTLLYLHKFSYDVKTDY